MLAKRLYSEEKQATYILRTGSGFATWSKGLAEVGPILAQRLGDRGAVKTTAFPRGGSQSWRKTVLQPKAG